MADSQTPEIRVIGDTSQSAALEPDGFLGTSPGTSLGPGAGAPRAQRGMGVARTGCSSGEGERAASAHLLVLFFTVLHRACL